MPCGHLNVGSHPACARDASGRALPLRGEVILAVQLSMAESLRFAHGVAAPLGVGPPPRSQFDDATTTMRDWMFDMPMDHIDHDVLDGPWTLQRHSLYHSK